eukprot:NODE_186_length_2388_cov_144.026979_g181_i0.p1 GENE.NODE_186_length_2388_cov_144.026979_g181_i0~~NODE_186_length_2388_cov_144.026979_g181_i0.p1  ORF type:complete len:725 (+),score=187.87 NODE_186_length_2388_cov_144.026979_g181_i0:94-2268(+)
MNAQRIRRKERKRAAPGRLGFSLAFLVVAIVGLGWVGNFGNGRNKLEQLSSALPNFTGADQAALPTTEDGDTGRKLLQAVESACVVEESEPAEYTQEKIDCYLLAIGSNKYEELESAFPADLFCRKTRLYGAIILHILGMLVMFCGLAVICDEYFVPSLEVISERLKLKDDVAGATFMAAGGSAPELATSVLGVFVAQSDVGFGTIVGSAVFNVLFVVAGCAFVAPNVGVTWYPLARDCTYYCLAIIVLVIFVLDQAIFWYEALLLLIGYAGYVTVMKFNEELEIWVTGMLQKSREPRAPWRCAIEAVCDHWSFQVLIGLVIVVNCVFLLVQLATGQENLTFDVINYVCSGIFIAECLIKIVALSFFGYCSDGLNVFDGTMVILIILDLTVLGSGLIAGARVARLFRFARFARFVRMARYILKDKSDASTQWEPDDWEHDYVRAVSILIKRSKSLADVNFAKRDEESVKEANKVWQQDTGAGGTSSSGQGDKDPNNPEVSQQDELGADKAEGSEGDSGSEEEDDDDLPNPFDPPDTWGARIYFIVMWPLSILIYLTVPHCKRPMFKKLFFLTFFLSIVWIGILSYLMVWWATIIGWTWGIPTPVMGVTILAAGTSVPDLMESLAVARRGLGDMAVSSSIGSNVFDLLMGLPLPWLLKTGIVDPNSCVLIRSQGLTIMVLTLFIMVGLTISTINFESWKLTKRLGWIMLCLYFLFVAESLLLEYL